MIGIIFCIILVLVIVSLAKNANKKANVQQYIVDTEKSIYTNPIENLANANETEVCAPQEKHSLNIPRKHSDFVEIELPDIQIETTQLTCDHTETPAITEFIAFYENGELYDIDPRNKKIPLYEEREIAYQARYIVSDGVKYDLESAESIKSIVVPKFKHKGGISSPTGNLDYILKMRVGMEHRPYLAVVLAYKVANLMIASNIGWGKKDYYKLVTHLWSIGQFQLGDHLLEALKARLPIVATDNEATHIKEKHFDTQMSLAKKFGQDYVQIAFSSAICPECAPYQNRIYSISGQDKRFPKLPEFIKKNKGLHCNISIYSTFYYDRDTITQYIYKPNGDVVSKEVDAIKYSNRPFIDDRSIYEKNNYDEWKSKDEKRKHSDAEYYSREYWVMRYNDAIEYEQIIKLMGDKAPKSYNGYRRMKKSNTANFQKIVKIATENGVQIRVPE